MKILCVLICLFSIAVASEFNSLEEFKADVYDYFAAYGYSEEELVLYYGGIADGGNIYAEPNYNEDVATIGYMNIAVLLDKDGDWIKIRTTRGVVGWLNNKQSHPRGGDYY